jgi:integrase
VAWAEKLKGGYRGRYYDQNGVKQTVLQADGALWERKQDAKDAAEEERAKARRKAAVKKGTQAASITWSDWWDTIVEDRQFDSDTPRTESAIVETHIRPWWGETPLNDIEQGDIQDWVDDRKGLKVRKGMSPAYARRIFGVFSASINTAVKKRILGASPCVNIELPPVPKRKKAYATPKKIEALDLRPDYADMLMFQIETGLRPGELCGLHQSLVDLERGWMTVSEVLVARRKAIRAYPKDHDHREVPLSPLALEIVQRNIAGRPSGGGCGLEHLDGSKCTSALVFLTERGKVAIPDTVGRYISRAAEKRKVERTTMYPVRRGFITRVSDGGLSPFDVAEVVGHSDPKQSFGYWQQTPAARARVIEALGRGV